MDASVFAKMLSGPGQLDLKKMGYKYGQENLQEFLALRKQYFYQELPLHDFDRNSMVYLDKAVQIPLSAARCFADAATEYPSVWNQGDGR